MRTAIHEAGHCVVASTLGLVVERVTITPTYDQHYRRWRSGTTQIKVLGDHARDFSPEMKRRLRAEAVALFAGSVAERRACGRVALDESRIDARQARWLLSRDTPPRDLPRVLRAAQATAAWLVREHWPEIQKLAQRLVHERTVTMEASRCLT